MLRITEDAAQLVTKLTDDAHLAAGAGLRIGVDPRHDSLEMTLAEAPDVMDSVSTSHGVSVFLAPKAAARLHHSVLRADFGTGRATFFLDRSDR